MRFNLHFNKQYWFDQAEVDVEKAAVSISIIVIIVVQIVNVSWMYFLGCSELTEAILPNTLGLLGSQGSLDSTVAAHPKTQGWSDSMGSLGCLDSTVVDPPNILGWMDCSDCSDSSGEMHLNGRDGSDWMGRIGWILRTVGIGRW